MNVTQVVEIKGLACPMPIVRTKKAVDGLNSGDIVEIHVTDKGAVKDIPSWVAKQGHTMLKQTEENGILKFWIQKA
ncbi:MAG: sulfurtransferase TusA family protein [Ectobacillus sp.]